MTLQHNILAVPVGAHPGATTATIGTAARAPVRSYNGQVIRRSQPVSKEVHAHINASHP
jgi:hypothetical protein